MGKLIKIICGLFFILCCTNSYAGPKSLAGYPWLMLQMPMHCGPLADVNKVLKIEGYTEQEASLGRNQALPNGEIVYIIMTYESKDIPGHIIRTIETAGQNQKCVLHLTFDRFIIPEKN
jgi:hypothetical protein